jgi:acyl-CoA synthetase (AMP-forming)/AMP-acid ligase II
MTGGRIDLIHELVSSAAAAVPDRAAIICPDGTAVAFAQFDRQIGSVAAWVSQRTRRGDRVAVIADNSAAYARLYYGVPRADASWC